MDMLQLREKEIFEALKKIKNFNFVIIGGYAVSAYALPRFSVDCDIVVMDSYELGGISEELNKSGYIKQNAEGISAAHHGKFVRYEKSTDNNFKASIDILFRDVFDRQTNATFSAEWIFENSSVRPLKGKTITEELKLRVINPDALIVMKSVSCRITDIRDVFMLVTQAKDMEWIRKEIEKRCCINGIFKKIKDKISSKQFKDNLQGVHGNIDEGIFNKHKEHIFKLIKDS